MENFLNQLGRQNTFRISEPSEIAAVRRAGNELGRRLGFDETRTGQLAIMITEAATNILKHAGSGEILLRSLQHGGIDGVEVIAIDAGPGMSNITPRMQDGYSTVGTYGVGLGAIQRLAHELDIYSQADKGTVLVMLIWSDPAGLPERNWEIGAVCLPIPSEVACGDSWRVGLNQDGLSLMIADGLGHGPHAEEASRMAVALVDASPTAMPAELLQKAHADLRGSRGAAAAVARIDRRGGELRYCGVGNIAACLFGPKARQHLLSHDGIVGSNLRRAQEFVYSWFSNSILILHTDGLATRWDLNQYPGLAERHASLIAAVLYRDFSRKRDDVTVLVIRDRPED